MLLYTNRMELMIGRVVKSHGIRGEVVVESTTDDPDIRYALGEVLRGKQGKKEHTLTIDAVRVHQGRLLIKFAEVPDRTAADPSVARSSGPSRLSTTMTKVSTTTN